MRQSETNWKQHEGDKTRSELSQTQMWRRIRSGLRGEFVTIQDPKDHSDSRGIGKLSLPPELEEQSRKAPLLLVVEGFQFVSGKETEGNFFSRPLGVTEWKSCLTELWRKLKGCAVIDISNCEKQTIVRFPS